MRRKRRVFPTDESVKKVVWLTIQTASQKWTMPLSDWRMAMSRFIIGFLTGLLYRYPDSPRIHHVILITHDKRFNKASR
ncbi:transposase [Escherichia coli]|nr:transposase [Escherichia coli]